MYQFSDPFDDYNDITKLWDASQLTNGGIVFSSSFARFPAPSGLTSQGIKLNQNCWCRKNLLGNIVTHIGGFAWSPVALPSSGIDPIWYVEDNGTIQVSLAVTSTGAFQFYRGAPGGTAIGAASASALVMAGGYYFLEPVVTIDPAAGTVALYIGQPASGGVAAISSTGLNTRATANTFVNQVRLIEGNSVSFYLFDDLYVFDATTGSDNARLGDQRLITKMPSGVGGLTAWPTLVGAATTWQALNEIPPNDDTSYIASATAGQRNSSAMQSAGLTTTPNFVVSRHRIRKDDAGAHVFTPLVRSGGVVGLGTGVAVPSTYAFVDNRYLLDPNTAAAWGAAGADATELGEEMTS